MGGAYQIRDQEASYFLTFQVVGWVDVFSRQLYRDIILESFNFCRESKGLKLYSYVIMTNHVHVIMRSELEDLSGLMRDFKKYTSKKILEAIKTYRGESRREWMEMIFKYHAKYNKRVSKLQLWTHENHAVELHANEPFDIRMNYIHENPVRSSWVEKPEDYLYSSARNYAGLDALIDVDLI